MGRGVSFAVRGLDEVGFVVLDKLLGFFGGELLQHGRGFIYFLEQGSHFQLLVEPLVHLLKLLAPPSEPTARRTQTKGAAEEVPDRV